MSGWANPAAMWDERFSREELIYGETPNTYFREQVQRRFKPGMNVLLPGDGYGRNGLWLARQGFHVHTVDLSSVGVERARKLAADAGVEMKIEQDDLTKWNWPEAQYDAVVSIFVHLPPPDRESIHAGMLRAAKTGGMTIAADCPRPAAQPGPVALGRRPSARASGAVSPPSRPAVTAETASARCGAARIGGLHSR